MIREAVALERRIFPSGQKDGRFFPGDTEFLPLIIQGAMAAYQLDEALYVIRAWSRDAATKDVHLHKATIRRAGIICDTAIRNAHHNLEKLLVKQP